VDENDVTQVLDLLSREFGKEAPLTGMRLHQEKQVQITMYDYIHNMMNELPPDMDGGATTPATNHLFSVNQDDFSQRS